MFDVDTISITINQLKIVAKLSFCVLPFVKRYDKPMVPIGITVSSRKVSKRPKVLGVS